MSRVQVRTGTPAGTNWWYLSEIGPVTGLTYSDTMPGGPESLACTLVTDPTTRHEALNPGRQVQAVCGASIIWEGTLDEPQPGEDGWRITAQGLGIAGSSYRDVWSSFTFASVVDNAISRGLRWARGPDAGGYTSEQHDSASQTVTEFLNLYTSPAGKTWKVGRDRTVSVFPIPTTVTRLLIATVPAVRTLAGYKNALYMRYKISEDTTQGAAATYGLTSATNEGNITAHGRIEAYWPLDDSGVMSAATAQGLGSTALSKYDAVSWAGPFQVRRGQYLNLGGAPVDLACEQAGEVVRLILADGPYGGEVSPVPPIEFPVGKVEYDDAEDTLQVTPFQYAASDWTALLEQLAPKAPA